MQGHQLRHVAAVPVGGPHPPLPLRAAGKPLVSCVGQIAAYAHLLAVPMTLKGSSRMHQDNEDSEQRRLILAGGEPERRPDRRAAVACCL